VANVISAAELCARSEPVVAIRHTATVKILRSLRLKNLDRKDMAVTRFNFEPD